MPDYYYLFFCVIIEDIYENFTIWPIVLWVDPEQVPGVKGLRVTYRKTSGAAQPNKKKSWGAARGEGEWGVIKTNEKLWQISDVKWKFFPLLVFYAFTFAARMPARLPPFLPALLPSCPPADAPPLRFLFSLHTPWRWCNARIGPDCHAEAAKCGVCETECERIGRLLDSLQQLEPIWIPNRFCEIASSRFETTYRGRRLGRERARDSGGRERERAPTLDAMEIRV
jgi:hypothetical protein